MLEHDGHVNHFLFWVKIVKCDLNIILRNVVFFSYNDQKWLRLWLKIKLKYQENDSCMMALIESIIALQRVLMAKKYQLRLIQLLRISMQ